MIYPSATTLLIIAVGVSVGAVVTVCTGFTGDTVSTVCGVIVVTFISNGTGMTTASFKPIDWP